MSLRQEIHAALDEAAPSTRGMPERVVEAVLAGRGQRSGGWALRVRAPLALVAVFMVIAVIAGMLMGGQLLRDWNSFHNARPAQELSPLAKLEARPLRFPAITSPAQCVPGPWNPAGDIGSGPFHSSGSAVEVRTGWGSYFYDFLYVDHQVAGPVLVRAEDLVTKQPLVFVGEHAGGPTIGTDTVGGQSYKQHVELVLPVVDSLGWRYTLGRPNGTSGCIGWQVDTPDLTETWVFDNYSAAG